MGFCKNGQRQLDSEFLLILLQPFDLIDCAYVW